MQVLLTDFVMAYMNMTPCAVGPFYIECMSGEVNNPLQWEMCKGDLEKRWVPTCLHIPETTHYDNQRIFGHQWCPNDMSFSPC